MDKTSEIEFQQANERLKGQIQHKLQLKFPGQTGVERMQRLLERLGNPQLNYKIIHVAGTTGKGSTTMIAAKLLEGQGYKVGYTTSPHIQDIRERINFNGNWISKQDFAIVNKQVFEQMEGDETFFEIIIAMALVYFSKRGADYAVIETGMGGLYDHTNALRMEDKVAVITRLGFDHTHILGEEIEQIAKHKAGIIHKGNYAISLMQDDPAANRVIESRAESVAAAKLKFVTEPLGQDIKLGAMGEFQRENAALALAAVKTRLALDGNKFDQFRVTPSLSSLTIPGRLEQLELSGGAKVIIDCAHNPQKMAGLIKNLPKNKYHFLVSFKGNKEIVTMLNEISAKAERITLTTFFQDNQDLKHFSPSLAELEQYLNESNFTGNSVLLEPSSEALEDSLRNAKEADKTLVITGSIYFLGEIYSLLKTK